MKSTKFEGDRMNRTEYKNNYQKAKYDRLVLILPKGEKDILKEHCDKLEMSVNEYIKSLIQNDLIRTPKENEEDLLDKWQIPLKYRHMIQECQYSKDNGYFIRLKKEFINDVTNSRIIQVQTTKEVRTIITKTHEK